MVIAEFRFAVTVHRRERREAGHGKTMKPNAICIDLFLQSAIIIIRIPLNTMSITIVSNMKKRFTVIHNKK